MVGVFGVVDLACDLRTGAWALPPVSGTRALTMWCDHPGAKALPSRSIMSIEQATYGQHIGENNSGAALDGHDVRSVERIASPVQCIKLF
jgi:hypothetical protein